MAKSGNQKGKLLYLAEIFHRETDEAHGLTLAELTERLAAYGVQAERKTLYADMEELRRCGLDIDSWKEGREYRYRLASREFELPELKLLVDAVESSRFITEKKSTALIKKLGHLTSTAQAEQLNRRIYMGGTPKPENESIYYNVDTIHNAVQKKQQITFQYFEYTPKKEKVLKHDGYKYRFSPYAMIWNRDCYYAVGWSEKHGKIAQFRVDRMTAVEPLEQTAVQTLDFDPAEYVRKVFGMYPDDLCTVELLCDNEVMRSVIDRFGENVQTETVDEQHFRATVEVAPSPPFFSWVFTFSGKIRIVSPAAVLEEMRDMAAWLK